jgi:hypothetical protein
MRHLLLAIACATLALSVVPRVAGAGCGDGIVDVGEQCDRGATSNPCCTASCTFASELTLCRASAQPCDLPEACTGSSDQCPADVGARDLDGDGVCDAHDLCPFVPDPDQEDQSACTPQPLKKATAEERTRLEDGFGRFLHVATVAEGLGPVFNSASCAFCHDHPMPGGFSPRTVTRFGRYDGGAFDPMESEGGSLIQAMGITTPTCSVFGEAVPPGATVSTLRLSTPILGAGLVEAIPAATILARADASDANGDGISGRPNMIGAEVGRFGWKAQIATVRAFASDAALNEMGITNPDFPTESAPQGGPVTCDAVPDPEDDGTGITELTNFMTLAAPLTPNKKVKGTGRGRGLFKKIGCIGCHVEKMKTGDSPSKAFRRQQVRLFSDLLLHDMGPALADGIEQGQATGNEFRTAPLWGVGRRGPFLHDGRAATLLDAVVAHGGEAQAVRDRFMALEAKDRDAIVLFLSSL